MHEYGQNNSLFIELLNNTKKVIQARVDSFNCPASIGRIPYKIAPKVSGLKADKRKNWTMFFPYMH